MAWMMVDRAGAAEARMSKLRALALAVAVMLCLGVLVLGSRLAPRPPCSR